MQKNLKNVIARKNVSILQFFVERLLIEILL